jgi:hypothetical protein
VITTLVIGKFELIGVFLNLTLHDVEILLESQRHPQGEIIVDGEIKNFCPIIQLATQLSQGLDGFIYSFLFCVGMVVHDDGIVPDPQPTGDNSFLVISTAPGLSPCI